MHENPLVALRFAELVPVIAKRDLDAATELVGVIAERKSTVESEAWTAVRLEMVFRLS